MFFSSKSHQTHQYSEFSELKPVFWHIVWNVKRSGQNHYNWSTSSTWNSHFLFLQEMITSVLSQLPAVTSKNIWVLPYQQDLWKPPKHSSFLLLLLLPKSLGNGHYLDIARMCPLPYCLPSLDLHPSETLVRLAVNACPLVRQDRELYTAEQRNPVHEATCEIRSCWSH